MALLTVLNVLFFALMVHGASIDETRGVASGGTSITEEGDSQAVGIASGINEHSTDIFVLGSQEVPAILSVSTGSILNFLQYGTNYQQSQINPDSSSEAVQSSSASNSASASNYLNGDIQGLQIDVNTSGWSALEGESAAGQADVLQHEGNPASSHSGWRQP